MKVLSRYFCLGFNQLQRTKLSKHKKYFHTKHGCAHTHSQEDGNAI